MKINDMLDFTCKKKTAMHLSTTQKNLKRKLCIPVKGKLCKLMTCLISPEKEICYASIYNGKYWLMLHTCTSEMENTG